MITILAYYAAALVLLIAIGYAVSGAPGALWAAALAAWVLSFLGSFSIGSYTLVATVVLLSLAIGTSAGWIATGRDRVMATLIGIALWALAVSFIDDYWLFFPFSAIGSF